MNAPISTNTPLSPEQIAAVRDAADSIASRLSFDHVEVSYNDADGERFFTFVLHSEAKQLRDALGWMFSREIEEVVDDFEVYIAAENDTLIVPGEPEIAK